ncbi:MAG: efflux RND transporter permease subunit [Candidatus Bipolaricaulaceae bacterium]
MSQWALDGLTYLARRQAVPVVVIAAVLVGLSVYYIRDLPIRSSYLDLLPEHDPLIAEYRAKQEELAGTDYMAVLLTLATPPPDRAARTAALFAAAEELIAQLDHPEIKTASYRVGEGITYPSQLLLFRTVDPEDLARLQDLAEEILATLPLSPGAAGGPFGQLQGLQRSLEELLAAGDLSAAELERLAATLVQLVGAARQGLAALATLPRAEPLLAQAADIIREIQSRSPPPTEGTPLLARDATKLVVQIRPRQPAYAGLEYCKAITALVEEAVQRAELPGGVIPQITGSYAAAAEADQIIRGDMNLTTWASSVGVFLLLLATFGSLFLTTVALVPLLVSALLTMAWAKFAVGGFNLVTSFLPALVLGLGIDFAIHLILRYVEERAGGGTVGQALSVAIHRKGEASLAAALTTAAVFLSLLVSQSRALDEMGVIMSVGIVVAFLAAMLLTPSLIALSYVSLRRRFRERLPVAIDRLARPYRKLLGQRRAVVTLGLLLTLALSYQVSQVEFRFVSTQLAPPTNAQTVAEEILQEFQGTVSFGESFVFFVSDPGRLEELAHTLEAHPLVAGTSSIRELLPQELLRGRASLQDVPAGAALDGVRAIHRSLTDWKQLVRQVDAAAARLSGLELAAAVSGRTELAASLSQGGRELVQLSEDMGGVPAEELAATAAHLEQNLQVVKDFLTQLEGLPAEPELISTLVNLLPQELKAQYYTETTGRYVLRVRLRPGLYQGRNLRQFLEFVRRLDVDYFGIPEVQSRLESYMKRDFAVSTGVACLAIALLALGSFRNWRRAVLAVLPLVIGYVWMLAGMRLLGIAFNFTNIVISPLLIGIGVDSAIHILHRIREEGTRGLEAAAWGAATSALPVLSTSLTTMLVFGILVAAQTPGLRFLGISALLGLGFTLLASLVLLPAAATWVDDRRPED